MSGIQVAGLMMVPAVQFAQVDGLVYSVHYDYLPQVGR